MASDAPHPVPTPPRRPPVSVEVVLVHYRTPDLCLRALASLAAEREQVPGLRATVVENGSGDGSLERLAAGIERAGWGAWVELFPSAENLGFAGGANRALARDLAGPAPAAAYLLLNPDAALDPGCLGALLDALERHPEAGFVGPLTEIGRGHPRTTAFRFPGVLSALEEGLHLGLASRLLARWSLSPPLREEEHETDWLSGGCLLVRRRVLEEVGLLDPGYFLYFEETDLQWAARRKGWRARFVPGARALHDAGAATGCTGGHELERRVPAYWFASRRRYLSRTRGALGLLACDLAWLAANGLHQLRRALLGGPRRDPPGFYGAFVRHNLLRRRAPEPGPVTAPGAAVDGGPRPRLADPLGDLGAVVIARNEGERLVRSLASLPAGIPVVYVDSASTDGSPDRARAAGADVVELDVSRRPPNQPRGRNAGFRRLREIAPGVRHVLFLDGDCELAPGFLEGARAALERDPRAAAACGRRRELHPRASLWNFLVDTEWNTPVGLADEFGGDVLLRVEALVEAGLYDESMVSGEDHELAFRLRSRGWRIHRLPLEMTRHDVALRRFGAWWRRHARGGYAYAHGAALRRGDPGAFRVARVAGILLWGALLPAAALLPAPWTGGRSLALLGALAWPLVRTARWRRSAGDAPRDAWTYAAFATLGKLAEAQGVVTCLAGLARRRAFRYVEYKDYQAPRGPRAAA